MGGTARSGSEDVSRVEVATATTESMAAYFYGALRDQASRASAFERQLRWARMRQALVSAQVIVAEPHRFGQQQALTVTTSAELPVQRQAVAG